MGEERDFPDIDWVRIPTDIELAVFKDNQREILRLKNTDFAKDNDLVMENLYEYLDINYPRIEDCVMLGGLMKGCKFIEKNGSHAWHQKTLEKLEGVEKIG